MKKSIISIILCVFMIFCASCTITVPYESEEESLIESEQETTSESVEQEEAPDPTEIEYVYTPLDETVKADIEAYLGKTFYYGCYYGEFEGKHVFYIQHFLASVDHTNIGAFRIFSPNVHTLRIWDGNELVDYHDNKDCDIFSFEASKEIAFIHLNHLVNRCASKVKCTFENDELVNRTCYVDRWNYMVGGYDYDLPRIKLRVGEYSMQGYCAEGEVLFSGDMHVLGEDVYLPKENEKTLSIFVTIENIFGTEEKFNYYGTLADVLDMYQITEDMWLDSYDGFIASENFDLEKVKALKYCVPIYTADTINLNVEICLVLDHDKDKNTYILVMDIDEETGKKYISGVYHYQWVREQQE